MSKHPDPAESSANLFLSWSEEPSRSLAASLKNWLPEIFEDKVSPWFSEDIEPGELWMEATLKAPGSHPCGLFILTPASRDAPWIFFEAGAIAAKIDKTRIFVLLVGLARARPARQPSAPSLPDG